MSTNRDGHIRITSHPGSRAPARFPIRWGAPTARERGPVIGTVNAGQDRNAIGAHGGSYALYRALAISSGALNPIARPDLTNTSPVVDVGPFPQWSEPSRIVSLDPWGHRIAEDFRSEIAEGIDIRPSIAITKARLTLPDLNELVSKKLLSIDGEIVRASGDVAVTKAALDPVWYLPGIAERFGISEDKLRRTLFEQTGGMYPELVTRPDMSVFLPPIGGITLYIFGDPAAISDPRRTLACRVHDECNGSDVFGSDICTCRPYLIHGIAECIKEAQKGGAGLIAYNRKEGRALGEVTKFLVYNARKRQPGGDQASTYFERTECVAGVQDARFQQLMPDVLHWLGITRIDRFMSMSNMKYDAITSSGIDIGERVPIPDALVPDDAKVEIEAKKAAGYFAPDKILTEEDLKAGRAQDRRVLTIATRPHDPGADAALSLLSAQAVRARAHEMLEIGLTGGLQEFTIDPDALKPAAAYVARVIHQNYPDLNVPLHARWRHFTAQGRDLWAEIAGRVRSSSREARARSAFDLAIVSVLLDAGAGPDWSYRDESTGLVTGRSEGLAIASLRMFEAGAFSGDPRDPLRADANVLSNLTAAQLAAGFQVSTENPLAGLEGRAGLLSRLGKTIAATPSVFAMADGARPGGLFDALSRNADQSTIPAPDILRLLLLHLGPIWPGRITLGGISLGDTWKHPAIKRTDATDGLVPFHKLSQWLSYSLIEPLQEAGLKVIDVSGLTGLAEYRNGGLFVDTGVIAPRDPAKALQPNAVESALIVEWRALTIALLDRIAPLVCEELGVDEIKFPLGCVLEGGTWAAGRALARDKRADGGPPIRVVSDGTVF